MLVQMELCRIIIHETRDQNIVFLKEAEGPRMFPILIGLYEATSIDREVRGEVPLRPLTHDLLKNTIDELGGEIQDIVVNELLDHTYYSIIRIRKDGELIEIDSRPSDAFALSVRYDPPLPIFVSESILDQVA